MPLTQKEVENAKPDSGIRRIWDSQGLYLEISPAGGKWWRLKFRIGGKEKRMSLGTFPDVSLKAARRKRDEARSLLADGTDPSAARKAAKRELGRQGCQQLRGCCARVVRQSRRMSGCRTTRRMCCDAWNPICSQRLGRSRLPRYHRRCCWRRCGNRAPRRIRFGAPCSPGGLAGVSLRRGDRTLHARSST